MRSFEPCRRLYHRLAARAAAEEARARRERRVAADRYDELMTLAPGARRVAIAEADRLASFALADLLLDVSRDVCAADPEAGRELARLALAMARRLHGGRYLPSLVADLEARGWAYLGSSRVSTDPAGAREAFIHAESCLARGSGDPLAQAEILCLSAGVLDDAGLGPELPESSSVGIH